MNGAPEMKMTPVNVPQPHHEAQILVFSRLYQKFIHYYLYLYLLSHPLVSIWLPQGSLQLRNILCGPKRQQGQNSAPLNKKIQHPLNRCSRVFRDDKQTIND